MQALRADGGRDVAGVAAQEAEEGELMGAEVENLDWVPKCDRCKARPAWVVQNYEGEHNTTPINRWYGCGRHIHAVLRDSDWEMDAVQIQAMDDEEDW